MHAIILAGGYGTRLQSSVPNLPKALAPIQGKPFLAYLFEYLESQGITDIIIAVHYLAEKIISWVESYETNLSITFVKEDQPLLTGGAIVNALSVYPKKNPVFVLNGDTFMKLDYQAMVAKHLQNHADLTMTVCKIKDNPRYGKVIINNSNRVTGFGETETNLINAGVYLIQPELFSSYCMPRQFSFEQDFLPYYLATLNAQAFLSDDYFIDIGVPEDYLRANNDSFPYSIFSAT